VGHPSNSGGDDESTSPQPPFYGLDWTDELEQIPVARKLILDGSARLHRWLLDSATIEVLSLPLLISFHWEMFGGVFPELAGRFRGPSPNYIPMDVTFWKYRGAGHRLVPYLCEGMMQRLSDAIRQLDKVLEDLPPDAFMEEALRAAAFAHCKLIEIHPFVNGNGRTARACVNYFAARYGYRLLPFTRPKGNYLDANRTWLQYRTVDHFMDFLRPMWLPET
jgi:fido (protein-threonine AMPylation protein)